MAASADDRPTRRDVLKAGAAAVAVTGLGVRSEARADAASVTATQNSPVSPSSPNAQPAYDFVVVGSGAGGGTVAARLVESGFRVLLLEAGLDPLAAASGNARPEDYQVPAFHPFATENPSMRWDFWVRHYASTGQKVEAYPGYNGWYGYGDELAVVEQGTIVVDFVSPKDKHLLWRGKATSDIDEDMTPAEREKRIIESVQKILEQFPPKR